ncbi:hypothetical protein GBAR_LOCUS26273 [Geodia barretti]|uniref:Uncharacterized protein n=1 Tax=Geodia barretti TaxID=519541 RepID=A0AA35TGG4_GEOBA|nr:hypothetical protein GBAR_LOCUS26273 [Geodia barretti]
MSSTAKEKWGFSSQPVHMQVPKYPLEQQQEEEHK